MHKILIIVPAYNESKTIVDVINALHEVSDQWDIVIVNDCSSDNTASLASETKKAYVINLPVNLGIGGAVQTGFLFAVRNNYNIAVQFDGDHQHYTSEITKIIQPIVDKQADVVIGSRFLEKSDSWKSSLLRRVGIKLFEIANFLLTKQRITDNTSGFRAYNYKAIQFLSKNYPVDYPEPEAVIILNKNDFIIKEVFVRMKERTSGRSSIAGLKSFYYMTKVMLGILMHAMRPKLDKGE